VIIEYRARVSPTAVVVVVVATERSALSTDTNVSNLLILPNAVRALRDRGGRFFCDKATYSNSADRLS
jgi:hypothetical protein